jgi:hypothetical protein
MLTCIRVLQATVRAFRLNMGNFLEHFLMNCSFTAFVSMGWLENLSHSSTLHASVVLLPF